MEPCFRGFIFGIGGFLQPEIAGSVERVYFISAIMAPGYIAPGMILGTLISSNRGGFIYRIVLLPTISSGA